MERPANDQIPDHFTVPHSELSTVESVGSQFGINQESGDSVGSGSASINYLNTLPWRSAVAADRWQLNLCVGDQCELFDLNSDPYEFKVLVDAQD